MTGLEKSDGNSSSSSRHKERSLSLVSLQILIGEQFCVREGENIHTSLLLVLLSLQHFEKERGYTGSNKMCNTKFLSWLEMEYIYI